MRYRGFTLIEVTIVLSIFAVASIIIGSIYISHSKFYTLETAAAEIKSQKNIFTLNFIKLGQSANSVEVSYIFSGITRISSSSTVIFKIPAIDGGGNIINAAFDYAVFYREGNSVFLETSANGASIRKNSKRQLSDAAQELVFRYDTALPQDAQTVGVSLYIKKDAEEADLDISAHLRNKQ